MTIELIEQAIRDYKPRRIVGLFSGGHDSLSTIHYAQDYLDAIAFVDTGINIPACVQFVQETCEKYGWELITYKSPFDYDKIVLEYGFPGPAQHGIMYSKLKERAIRQLVRQYKTQRRDRIMLITGVRQQESMRRKNNVKPVQREGARLWIAPIFDWSKVDVETYIRENGITPSPVMRTLHQSGDCLCGAYAHEGELSEICFWYPETGKRIRELQSKVSSAGFPWGWEDIPPEWFFEMKKGQLAFDFGMLCQSCHDARK